MHCKCGHSLRTDMEIDDGQCIRCSSKPAVRLEAFGWFAVGSAAYHNDAERVPLMDADVMRALDNGGDVLAICRVWLNGWDMENLAEPA